MNASGILSTQQAQEWLDQFGDDQKIASMALEGVRFISAIEFENGILDLIKQKKDGKQPTALFAIRELNRIWIPEREKTRIESYFSLSDKKQRPSAVGSGAGVGSEGIVSRLIRNIARTEREGSYVGLFLDHPSLNSMAQTKVHQVFLIDDFVGSGMRASTFVEGFCSHPTIKSCLSYGILKINIVCFAATEQGINQIQKYSSINSVITQHIIPQGSPHWSYDKTNLIKNICRKYAGRTSRPSMELGYNNAFTFLVFQHKCPNTVPSIFWAKSKKWQSIFDENPQLGLATWPTVSKNEHSKQILEAIGQTKLAVSDWDKYTSPLGHKRLLILAFIAKGYRKIHRISQYTEMSITECSSILQDCKDNKWVDQDNTITNLGLNELKYAKQISLKIPSDIKLKNGYYFPQSLRG